MSIGERLKLLRKDLGLTQEVFASRIGSVQNSITGYENGRRIPSSRVILLICKEFHVNEEWLRYGSGEMFSFEQDNVVSLSENRVKRLRHTLNLTQAEFAQRLSIKRNTIANYETGRNFPVDSVVALICREFHVNEEWLRYGSGEMFSPEPDEDLKVFAEKYDLSSDDLLFIKRYALMDKKSRRTFFRFIKGLVAESLTSSLNDDVG